MHNKLVRLSQFPKKLKAPTPYILSKEEKSYKVAKQHKTGNCLTSVHKNVDPPVMLNCSIKLVTLPIKHDNSYRILDNNQNKLYQLHLGHK